MRHLSKYRAKPCRIDGVRFASQREGARYLDLRLLEKAGEIRGLEFQPVFPLSVIRASNGEVVDVGRYTADFAYFDVRQGKRVIEDVKSKPTRTTAYRLRKRIAEAVHGISITEVG